jgi:OmpA-OmpF porin, OOP family
MSSNVLSSSKAIWSLGLLAFAILCFFCISSHAPQLLGLSASTVALPAATTLASTNLEARLLNGKVTLTGTLPDESAKAQLLARAKELYGDGNFMDNVKVSNQTAFPTGDWLGSALALLPFASRMNNEGGFALDGKTVTVRGLVETDDTKSKLIADTVSAVGKDVRVEDKIMVRGKITAAQASDFQARLNQMLVGKIVEFDTNSDLLTDKGKAVLDEMVKVLGEVPGVPVEIGGHTDSRGNAGLNQNLSQRRARSCLQYLVQKGVDARRLSSNGYGSLKPIADNNTPEGQQRNRRIEFNVLKEGK